jgi:hypothetical protein
LKIGLPRIRFSRKVLLISVGMLALLAGSGAAALYVGAGHMLARAEPEDSPIGGECSTVETMVLKTPAKRLWLRKTIRMEHADGPTRIKTALRVAGLLANANPVDLVQVSVLDASGPVLKSRMRGRAIGAEVVIALQPKYLPDMKEPFVVRYYEGMPSDEGMYYGERISLEVPEIRKLMGAMKTVPDKRDCTALPRPDDKNAKAPGDHIVSVEGEKPAEHETKPAHEEEMADDHAASAEDGKEAPKKGKSFLDSVLSMVGLGGSEEKPAEGHEAKISHDKAVPDDAVDPAPRAEDHASEPTEKDDAAPAETDADAAEHQPVKALDATDKHVGDDSLKSGDHVAEDEVH